MSDKVKLKRFGVSIPKDLLQRFDSVVESKGYVGRSEAIRDSMRDFITQYEWETEQEGTTAAINIVYEHKPRLMADLMRAQHGAEAGVVTTVHIHLTDSHCLEVLVVRGTRKGIEKLASRLGGLSGIEYVRLFTFSLPDEDIHGHSH
ncbi:MAG: nickel-responsive transcriptional regulator NikR [Candidatus Thorarchaeota archaeon]|nr:MAG: nickel-responsive transcriptional regulator NikR [Candidatus Thorarchaeota archaeon]